AIRAGAPELLLGRWRRYEGDDDLLFWDALEQAARLEGVALVTVHAGPETSWRLIPRVDAFLKARLLRARVQLVSAGGDTDTQASAACVYEAVLLGANGGGVAPLAGAGPLRGLVAACHGAPAAGGPGLEGGRVLGRV